MASQHEHGMKGGTLPVEALKALVPETLGGWRRLNMRLPIAPRMPAEPRPVLADFERGTQVVTLSLGDVGDDAEHGLWTAAPLERATTTGSEKIYAVAGHTVREYFDRVKKTQQVTITLVNGLSIEASGIDIDAAALKQLVESVDLARAEKIERGPR